MSALRPVAPRRGFLSDGGAALALCQLLAATPTGLALSPATLGQTLSCLPVSWVWEHINEVELVVEQAWALMLPQVNDVRRANRLPVQFVCEVQAIADDCYAEHGWTTTRPKGPLRDRCSQLVAEASAMASLSSMRAALCSELRAVPMATVMAPSPPTSLASETLLLSSLAKQQAISCGLACTLQWACALPALAASGPASHCSMVSFPSARKGLSSHAAQHCPKIPCLSLKCCNAARAHKQQRRNAATAYSGSVAMQRGYQPGALECSKSIRQECCNVTRL